MDFLKQVINDDGLVAANALAEALHITQTDLAKVTGLSRDSVSKRARVKSRATQARLMDTAEIIKRVGPMVRWSRSRFCVVSRSATAFIWRQNRGGPGKGRSRGCCQNVSFSNRGWRLRLKVPIYRFVGIVYRGHHPMWAHSPLYGEGAKKHGGRVNRPWNKALYTSLDPTTAWMEAQQTFPFKPQPMTLVAYNVDCADIVDLTDPIVQNNLNSASTDLGCPWEDLAARKVEPPTWLLADRLKACDVAGISVRSFAPGCSEANHNLVLWRWSNAAPYSVKVIDDLGRLPKTPGSWSDDISGRLGARIYLQ